VKTSPDQKPPAHPFYGDSYVRGQSPWHRDAFPKDFKRFAPEQGARSEGWYLKDAYGNEISFIPDGTEFPPPTKP
jgi:hypothetical protein